MDNVYERTRQIRFDWYNDKIVHNMALQHGYMYGLHLPRSWYKYLYLSLIFQLDEFGIPHVVGFTTWFAMCQLKG